MAERQRSKDGRRETEGVRGAEGAVSYQGRSGGELQRDIASEDELKRSKAPPADATRVTNSKEQE